MAYSADVQVNQLREDRWEVVITETECGTASETEIPASDDGDADAIPRQGRFLTRRATLSSGSGTTLEPILGEQTDPATNKTRIVGETAAAAADIYDQAAPPVPYNALYGDLYHRSRPDAGADNAVVTVYHFLAGWE